MLGNTSARPGPPQRFCIRENWYNYGMREVVLQEDESGEARKS